MDRMDRFIIISMLSAILFFSVISAKECKAGEYRIGHMPTSHHFQDQEYNETHEGVILELRVGEEHWIGMMNYTNSFGDNSNAYYINYDYQVHRNISIGYQGGLVTGYEEYDPLPYVFLTVTIGGDHLKSRVMYLPEVVITYQLLLEF